VCTMIAWIMDVSESESMSVCVRVYTYMCVCVFICVYVCVHVIMSVLCGYTYASVFLWCLHVSVCKKCVTTGH
jgi:hypothetical protein